MAKAHFQEIFRYDKRSTELSNNSWNLHHSASKWTINPIFEARTKKRLNNFRILRLQRNTSFNYRSKITKRVALSKTLSRVSFQSVGRHFFFPFSLFFSILWQCYSLNKTQSGILVNRIKFRCTSLEFARERELHQQKLIEIHMMRRCANICMRKLVQMCIFWTSDEYEKKLFECLHHITFQFFRFYFSLQSFRFSILCKRFFLPSYFNSWNFSYLLQSKRLKHMRNHCVAWIEYNLHSCCLECFSSNFKYRSDFIFHP